MKKLAMCLVVLAMAVPAYAADVTFDWTDNGDGTGNLTWTINKAETEIIGMGLDVNVSDGQIDTDGVAVDSFFDVFIDSAYSDPTLYDGATAPLQAGIPTATQSVAGALALPAAQFAVSVGHLEGAAGTNGVAGVQFTSAAGATFTVAENATRGGVVDQNGDALTTNLDQLMIDEGGALAITSGPADCIPVGHADNAEWVALGKPNSWCAQTQCYGDANGATEVMGRYDVAVGYQDLSVLLEGFGKTGYVDEATNPWIAADFNRAAEVMGRYNVRVGYQDLGILLEWFGKTTVASDCNN